MSPNQNVIEVTAQDFDQQVVARSHELPVLVDFWAEWCGPCQMLLPILLKLAQEYGGKFLLAKVNTDREQELAMRFGIRSIPTMKLYRNGEVVEELMGVQSEARLRALLDRYIERESDRVRAEARRREAQGDLEGALDLLRMAAAEDPENPRVLQDYARLAIQAGALDEARSLLERLPADVRSEDEVQGLEALLELAETVQDAPEEAALRARLEEDPEDLAAREGLAARLALRGAWREALDQYLEILKRDRGFHDGIGHRGMLRIFTLLGDDPLVAEYRRKLANWLY